MANENLSRSIAIVFGHEGGYTRNPDDPGNWSSGKRGVGRLIGTNHGIAAPTLEAYRRRPVTPSEMQALTKAEAEMILRANYWDSAGCGPAFPGCDLSLFDTSVNSGPGRAKIIGRQAGDMQASPVDWIKRYARARLGFMQGLAAWRSFGRGWSTRVASIEATSIRWAVAALGGSPRQTLTREADDSAAAAKRTKTQSATIGAGGAAAGGGASQVEAAQSAPWWVWLILIAAVAAPVALLWWHGLRADDRAKAMTAEAEAARDD